MTTGASDAELVQAHLTGDRGALAAIYDRYAPSLYDTATALLGDRDEAADVVQDTFLAATQHLSRLRDPARLRAWLFAIARHEVERRGRKRRRAVPTERVAEMAPPTVTNLDAELDHAELAALVRAAAAGLDERDQVVLELSMRQGLEGADLAAALGVTPAQSYSLVFRMRERVSRSLGALVVARTGRRDCADLAGILAGWDGTFSMLVRKRVARHVDTCDVCARTKARAALPALMVGAPAFALPVGLRDRVLAGEPTSATSEPAWDGDGFPTARAGRGGAGAPGAGRGRRRLIAAAAAVATAVLAGGAVLLAVSGSGADVEVNTAGTAPVIAEPTTSSTAPSTSAAATTTTGSTPTTASTSAPEVTIPPPPPPSPPDPPAPDPPPPAPARLEIAATSLSLGTDQSSATVEVTNRGGQGVAWSIVDVIGPIEVAGGGTLGPGQSSPVVVSIDRSGLAEGPVGGTFRVASPAGGGTVQVIATVARPPVIRSVAFADRAVRAGGCAPRATTVTVTASDESPLEVQAQVVGPEGRGTLVQLTGGSGRWTGRVGPFAAPGTGVVEIVATDALGQQASTARPLPVLAC